MVECLTRDQGAVVSSLTSVTALFIPRLVVVQPRKTRPYITEKLLMGHKESNQTKNIYCAHADTFELICICRYIG